MRKQSKWWLKRGKIVKNFRNFLFENDELLKKTEQKVFKIDQRIRCNFFRIFWDVFTFFKFGDFVLHVHFFYYFQQVILSIAPGESAIFLFYETNVFAHNG